MHEEAPVNVLLTVDFSEAELRQLAEVSSRLQFVCRPTPNLVDIDLALWDETEVLYTTCVLPEPEDVPRLRWVQLHSAGANHLFDHPLLGIPGIMFTTASGIHAAGVAEYVFAMFLAFGHRLLPMVEMKSKGEWPREEAACNRLIPRHVDVPNLRPFVPVELRGTTLGIVGYGSIGREVARLGATFGMTVLATKRDMRQLAEQGYVEPGAGDPEAVIVDRLYPPQALHSMLRECDFVALTVPLTAATRHLIDEKALAAMKPGAVLVNVSEGKVIDEAALVAALKAGKLGGVALDVFEQEPLPSDSPLWDLPRVILSPHTAGFSAQYNVRAARLFAENMRRYLAREPLLNLVERKRGY
ncbi:MAG: D-2-hydroxyacid dehydrogenase [Anaerolineae bacterium]|nr:D-2-hydroxyacid dehydrogenase [Anaerolineae bacterium]